MVKNLYAIQEIWIPSLSREDPLEKGMATHSSILAWRIPWAEEPGWLQSMGSQSDTNEWPTHLISSFVLLSWIHEIEFRFFITMYNVPTMHFIFTWNQILYDYKVEVRNRFKRLDLTDRVSEKLWMEVHDIVQETGIKTIPKKKKCKKAKWLSEEALQIAWKEEKQKAKEKRKDVPIWMWSSKE